MQGISQLAKNFLDCHRVMQTKNMKTMLHLKMSVTIYQSTGRDFIRECLLSVGTESFVFHFAIQKCKDIPNYNFACCFVWVLVLREERGLRMFENRVLRRKFEPKMDEVAGECRKLHNEELDDLYSRPSIVQVLKSRRIRWAGHVARMG